MDYANRVRACGLYRTGEKIPSFKKSFVYGKHRTVCSIKEFKKNLEIFPYSFQCEQ